MSEDFYTLLGVGPDASEETIRRAFRERVSEYHPDVSDDEDAGETIQQLNRAKDVLTDEERRREYDSLDHECFLERTIGDGRTASSRANRPRRTGGPPSGDRDRRDRRTHSAPETGTSGWGPMLFGGMFPGVGRRTTDRGWFDLRPFVQAGGSRTDSRDGPVHDPPSAEPRLECPRCGGRGRFVHELDTALGRRQRIEPCEQCGGTGTLRE